MKYKIILFNITITLIISILVSCGDQPLFTELGENRVKVIIKGTYESNNPRDWDTSTISEDDSVYVHTPAPEDEDTDIFMLDIAGMKVASGKHNQYFANFRKTYSSYLNNSDPFFNGTGFTYKNTDMRPDFMWQSIQMYIRKMIFNNAKQYQPDGVTGWAYEKDVEVIFQEEKTLGLNFNLLQTLTYYDYLKNNYQDINRIFPLNIPVEDGFIFDYDEEETVLEIRLVIKNFIKKYEFENIDSDGNHRLIHFFALSDWLRDVKKDEARNYNDDSMIGGNILTAARYWVPGKTATITGTATPNRYVVAIKSGHSISEYQFPLTERTRPDCDAPKAPRMPFLPSNDYVTDFLEALLDYYLEYETYKEDYDVFYDCVESGEYETPWNDYNTILNDFKIPPISTWCSDGSFTLTNVTPGNYRIYESASDPGPGSLPDFFTQIGTVTIEEDDFGQEVPLK